MNIRDIFKFKKITELEDKIYDLENVVDTVKNQPKMVNRTILTETIKNETAYREKQTIVKWRESLEYIEGYNNYTNPIYQIFREMYLDTHIQSTVLLRKSRVTSLPFEIEWIDEKREKEEDPIIDSVYNFINQEWFYKFLDYALDHIYEGYSAIEINNITENSLDVIKLPFNHLKPRYGVFVPNKSEMKEKGIKLNEEPYSNYVIEVFKTRTDLGLFATIAPLFLWSRNSQQNWSMYQEKFGQPIVVGKTAKMEATERTKMFNMLKSMSSSLVTLLDREDEIQMIQSSSTDAYLVYNELIKLCNDQINKIILGATMINQDGSSYSQSQVHQQQFDSLIRQDIRKMENVINNSLFPKLVNLGLIPEGLKLEFDTSESLNIFQKFEMDKALLPYYELDIEYMNKMYNTQIVGTKSINPFGMDQNTNNE